MGLITEDAKTGKTSDGLELGLGRPTRRVAVEDEPPPYSSEITLGMRSMLAIFFGLVLVCGVFFGLGYSVGRNGGLRAATDETSAAPALGDSSLKKPSATDQGLTPVPTQAAATNSDQNNTAQNDSANPNPNKVTETDLGSNPPANQTTPAQTSAPAAQPTAGSPQAAAAKTAPAQPAAQKTAPAPAPQTPAQRPSAATAAKPASSFSNPYQRAPQPAAPNQSSASPAPGGFMVQIAAVRQPQDANVLVSALQQHGFHAMVRHEAQDQLLHVQLGPFATRAEAFNMRSKLLANGYNAVVK